MDRIPRIKTKQSWYGFCLERDGVASEMLWSGLCNKCKSKRITNPNGWGNYEDSFDLRTPCARTHNMETLTLVKLLEQLCRDAGLINEEKIMREVFAEQTEIRRAITCKKKESKTREKKINFVSYQSYRSGPLEI